ncbi:MAG: sigma-E processing peptidase SpoIIGA [Clostridia bacterium]|nr:sigma-E processing peptidase SpoIIGA [Clostridia bacterium]
MVVYIEYAFLWNFLLDTVLLWLSLRAVKRKIRLFPLLFSALVGASFALVFPLLVLPNWAAYLLKFSVGFLLCFIAFGRIKHKKEWGKYALNGAFFFTFTFAFGGAILGVSGENPRKGIILLIFAFLTFVSLFLIRKLYAKRAVERDLYACVIAYKQKRSAVSGFYDSGNLAICNGAPVCFLAPDVFYDIWGEEIALGEMETTGQVCGEIVFSTVSGKKRVRAYLGRLEITLNKGETVVKKAYFAPSENMVLREYKLLLNSRIFE